MRHLTIPHQSPKPKSSAHGTPRKDGKTPSKGKDDEVVIDHFDHLQYEIPYEKHEVTETEKFLRDKKDRQAKARENEAKMERDRIQKE